MRYLRRLSWFLLAFLTVLFVPVSGNAVVSVTDQTVLAEGISAMGIDLGGLTLVRAKAKLNSYCEQLAGSLLTVRFDDQAEQISLRELGLSWNTDSVLTAAAAIGKSGSLLSIYKEKKDLQANGLTLSTMYTYDASAVRNFVEERIAVHDSEPVNASLRRDENRQFVVTDDIHGMTTDVEATTASILALLDSGLREAADLTVDATVQVTIPEVTGEMLSAVQDKLGTYHTDYSSSSSARKTNIRVAAERINGTLLLPGETFSLSDTILARTAANGYEMAPQYVNGDTELSYGGGVCQVATTLYNAVIRAEMTIVERHPHSMVVHYVPYSSDAAISEGNKDLVFTNSLDYPVYLASDADGSGLYFSVYGRETRPESRTVEFVSDTLGYKEMSPQIIEDYDRPYGEERVEGSTHPEVSSTLTKVVKENGEVISRELMNKDYYMGTSKKIYRGMYRAPQREPAQDSGGDSQGMVEDNLDFMEEN